MRRPASGRRASGPARRLAVVGLAASALALAGPASDRTAQGGAAVAAEAPGIVMVSRGRVLEEARAARRLADSEFAATEALQREIDAVKAALDAEEAELTRLRASLPRAEFEERVAAFDQRIREERRRAQSLAAALQRAYRDARRQLVEALDPILEEVRAELGAVMILDAESVLVADPSVDVTARVIELYDARVSVPVVVMPTEPGSRADPPAAEGGPGTGTAAPGFSIPGGAGGAPEGEAAPAPPAGD